MHLLSWLSFVGTLAYVALLLRYLHYWRPSEPQISDSTPFFSVILPLRNEADSIEACLHSLLDQDYPNDSYEIIVVDDLSEDGTGEKLRKFANVKVLSTSPEFHGKKHALSLGISASTGELIATTDGDCKVPPSWLRSFALTFTPRIHVATGPVLVDKPVSAIQRFQAVDLASLAMVTSSGIKSGQHHLGNGANMAFRKSTYAEIHGYEAGNAYASGDDLFLIQTIAAKYPDGVGYVWSREFVETMGIESIKAFFSQRMRWSSKNRALPERQIQYIWVSIWLLYVLLTIYVITSLFNSTLHLGIAMICIVSIFIAQYISLQKVLSYYGLSRLLNNYLVSAVMHFIYVLAMGFLTPFAQNYYWKGRRVR